MYNAMIFIKLRYVLSRTACCNCKASSRKS